MGISTAPGTMSSAEIAALTKQHTIFSWSVQGAVDPIAIDHAEGIYLYTPEGQRIIDFNSQLMSVNIGHGDRRVIDAINEQALKLQYVQPAFATEIRARLGAKLAEILPGDMDKVFFTLGGAEAIENAIKFARHATGRYKVLARYRSYHGATMGAMTLTGDPRRWANEPGLVGVVRYPDTHRWGEAEPRPVEREPPGPRGRHPLRGRELDRGGLPRDDRRHERHPHPARRLHRRGPRDLRPPRHPDGRRRGDGRVRPDRPLVRGRPLGRDARPHDDGQGPDLVVPAARAPSPCGTAIAEQFQDKMFYGGLTYSSHPVSLAAVARDDRGLRVGRPHRQRGAAGAGHARATTSAWRPSTRPSARSATSACSGSSISSGAATRGRRSPRSTAPRTR